MEILVFGLIGLSVVIGGLVYSSKRKKEPESNGNETEPEKVLESNLEPVKSSKEESEPIPIREKTNSSEGSLVVEEHQLVREAKNRAKEILLEARAKALQVTNEATEKASKLREDVAKLEKELAVEEARIQTQKEELKEKSQEINSTREDLEKRKNELSEVLDEQKRKLQEVSSLTREEARELLLSRFEKDLQEEKAKKIRQMEEDVKKIAERKSQEILLDALSHGTADYVVEYTTSKVKLPDPEMKGRIIGKEGRNITTFENLTGVELDLDSAPGEIIVSCFDPVRREVGKVALERLLADGRIQPMRIEDLVEETKKEIDHIILKEGEKLCHILNVYDLPKEVVETLGKFKYRFSYGQNLIKHTLEVANIGTVLAGEIGANVQTVKMGCLLHDIGKVLSPDGKGSHVEHGVEYLQIQGISEEVITCVKEHHGDKYSSIESALVALADHISGSRPGARSEDYESFAKRMKDLEEAALSFDGVSKAYAISAGREVRIFVEPKVVDDASAALLAREIARKIELEQSYPGVVNVTVIRETRVVETAR